MRNIVFHPRGWEDFTYWAAADKKMLRRRGGNRNARAVPNDVKRRRTFHTNDIYPNR